MLRKHTYQNEAKPLFSVSSEITFTNFSFTQGTGPFFSQPLTPPVVPETDISHYEVAIVSVADYSPDNVRFVLENALQNSTSAFDDVDELAEKWGLEFNTKSIDGKKFTKGQFKALTNKIKSEQPKK